MELLAATLAHIAPGRDADGLAHIRLISDSVRNAPGLVTSRFYRSRGHDPYYFMLTTWEDEESWRRAQGRYNPNQLLLGSASDLLIDPPEQWLMHYLWGYSRPAATPILATAHLATIRADQADRTQRAWIESLRRQAVQPTLAFAFLARGVNENTSIPELPLTIRTSNGGEGLYQHGSIFLNLLCWASEADREDFYADADYQAISLFLNSVGTIQMLTLDPL